MGVEQLYGNLSSQEKLDKTLEVISNKFNENDINFKIDNTDKTPGFKFAEAEVKGYPIRIEVGKRDLEQNKITFVRRDTLEKIEFKQRELEELSEQVKEIEVDITVSEETPDEPSNNTSSDEEDK